MVALIWLKFSIDKITCLCRENFCVPGENFFFGLKVFPRSKNELNPAAISIIQRDRLLACKFDTPSHANLTLLV